MVIVTHEMQFARAIADRVLFLEDGKNSGRSGTGGFFHRSQDRTGQKVPKDI